MHLENNELIRKVSVILAILILTISRYSYAQETNQEEPVNYFGGSATVTNNGVSLLPSFSLGEPAGILDMRAGRRLTFEPQFRFALEGRPWAFIFWWRYKLIDKDKFSIRVGAHPAILFRTAPFIINGNTEDKLIADRFIAGEISPKYQLTEHFSVGMYYLKGHGFQKDNIVDSDFITINCNFSNISLSDMFYMKFYPQVYYLRMDNMNGFYITTATTLAVYDFPLSIESIMNQPFKTDIVGGEDFLWNISLIYSFSNEFVKK